MFKTAALAALSAATLVLPGVASAQQFGFGWARPTPVQYYDQRRGDWDRDYGRRWGGYPEFRGIENHIRGEIQQGLRDDLIERDDARDLMGQLRDIQAQELREYRVHGWNLPADDRYRIRGRLQQLDRLVDQIRDEQ
jgi:hypothetical protein